MITNNKHISVHLIVKDGYYEIVITLLASGYIEY